MQSLTSLPGITKSHNWHQMWEDKISVSVHCDEMRMDTFILYDNKNISKWWA